MADDTTTAGGTITQTDEAAKAAADSAADAAAAAKVAADAKVAAEAGKGYPQNTPISAMTSDQRAAYFEDKARVEENRRKDMVKLTGGKYGDDLKAEMEELARLRSERMTDSEKAVTEAVTATRAEVAREYTEKLAAAEFKAALSHVDEDRRGQLIEGIALGKFLDNNGDVDTAKVKAHALAIAPVVNDSGTTRRDFGQGNRTAAAQATGLAAGAQLYADRTKKPTPTS